MTPRRRGAAQRCDVPTGLSLGQKVTRCLCLALLGLHYLFIYLRNSLYSNESLLKASGTLEKLFGVSHLLTLSA